MKGFIAVQPINHVLIYYFTIVIMVTNILENFYICIIFYIFIRYYLAHYLFERMSWLKKEKSVKYE